MIRNTSSFLENQKDQRSRNNSLLRTTKNDVTNNLKVWLITLFVSLGALLFGLDQGNFGGVQLNKSFVDEWCTFGKARGNGFGSYAACTATDTKNQPLEWTHFKALAASLITVGCAIGALAISPPIAKFWGRRVCIGVGMLVADIGTLGVLFAPSVSVFYLCRVFTGIGLGITTYALPMYISEIAPPAIRGVLGSLFQVNIVVGIAIAGAFNLLHANYKYSLGLPMIPATIVLLGVAFCPASPRYLMARKGPDAASTAMIKLRGTTNVNKEMSEIIDAARQEDTGKCINIIVDLCTKESLRKRLIIAIMLQWLQQFTGINAFFYYAPTIMKQAGVPDPLMAALYLAIANIFGTFLGSWLIDLKGRRPLLLWGSFVMVFSLALNALLIYLQGGNKINPSLVSPLLVTFSCIYIIGFAFGWGPIPWVYPSEIFPMRVKELAMSYSVASEWIANFVVAIAVPFLIRTAGTSGTFLIFCATCFIAGLYTFFQIPETKGKKLEEMDQLFSSRRKEIEVGLLNSSMDGEDMR